MFEALLQPDLVLTVLIEHFSGDLEAETSFLRKNSREYYQLPYRHKDLIIAANYLQVPQMKYSMLM